jgi:hypothetical protein
MLPFTFMVVMLNLSSMLFCMQDIWRHIHSLMPMRDAAQAACVSHAFLRSWRCHPNLTFCGTALGMNKKTCVNDEIARDFRSKVDQILKKHSGIGVKKLMIDMSEYYTTKDSCYLNSWLLIAVTPGIEELALKLSMRGEYNFPCSLLSNGSGDSIRYLKLGGCSMRPTAELPWLKSLTKVQLHAVCITGDELGCLLCNSFALERLVLRDCGEIVCLKIPCMLQRLRHLEVLSCGNLQVIDNKAPNISSFFYAGERIQLSLGDTLKMEYIHLLFSGALHYACVELPSSMPNLKIATIDSGSEVYSQSFSWAMICIS